MKNRIKIALSTALAMPVLTLMPVVAHAQDNSTGTSNNTTTTNESEAENKKTTLQERLQERKDALKTRLTAVQEARLKARCKTSQGAAIKSLAGRVKGLETSRHEVYENLVNRLEKASDKLEAKGLDVATLNSQIDTLKSKISTFEADLATYKQALSDLQEMDCVADPTAFQASLEAARTARAKVAQDAADIKTYATDTIKPTLVSLRTQLASLAANEESTESE